jgi:hypothetical protein
LNILGKISLLIALFCFLLTLGFKLALPGGIPFLAWGFGFGLFFLTFAVLTNFRFVLYLLRSESLHFIGQSLGVLVLVLGILVVLNFIVLKQNVSQDLTTNKIHSLSPLTQSLVKALPKTLNFRYFHADNAKVRSYISQVRQELEAYQRLNPNVKVQVHSIFKEPELAKKFKADNEESSLFVEFGDRIERVTSLNEMGITNALLKVTKEAKTIYFVQSHDEKKLNEDSTFGLNGLKAQLERLHYRLETVDISQTLPQDASVIVLAGPRQALSQTEVESLRQYLSEGGSLIVAADPGEDHQLNSFLKDYGVIFDDSFVFSKQAQAGQSELLVLTYTGRSVHPISSSINPGENPALFIASPLSLSNQKSEKLRITPLLEHLPNSYARRDISADSEIVQKGGPLLASVLVEDLESRFRMLVIGDSDFLTNQFYSFPGNFSFVLGAIRFLTEDEDLLKLKAPQSESTYLIMTQTQMNLYFLFFILPYCFVFFLVALFFKLRRLF